MANEISVTKISDFALQNTLERVINWSISKFGSDEIIKAKEDFFMKMGKVFYDDECYDNRMTLFTDHFLFERYIESRKDYKYLTPYIIYLKEHNDDPLILHHRYSIYSIVSKKNDKIYLWDILAEEKLEVEFVHNESPLGMNKNMIIQGFIFETKNKALLSNGLIFHPPESFSILKKTIKIERKNRCFYKSKFLSLAAKTQLKTLRHSHVENQTIYTLNSLS